MSSYDWLLARRALSIGAAIVVLALLVIASTDEESASLGAKLGRLAAVVAASGGLGAFVAAEQARARGELRALAALGVPPAKASLGAALGGAVVGGLGPLLVLLRSVDVAPLFPRLPASSGAWRLLGPGVWQDAAHGVVVRASGDLAMAAAPLAVPATGAGVSRLATGMALLLGAVSLPWWGASPCRGVRRAFVAVGAALVSVVSFHLVAAGRAPAWMLSLAPFLFVADAWLLHRGSPWS